MTINRRNDGFSYVSESNQRLGAPAVLALPPASLMTSDAGGNPRLRVDVAQTGFFDGREFRVIRKIAAPITFRFTFPVPVIVFEQALSVSSDSIELFAWAASNVNATGTWTPVTLWPKNGYNLSYTPQSSVASGGSVTPIDPQLYRDYANVVTSSATAQKFTVGGGEVSERYLAAGTYSVQLTGAGTGSYSIMFEERP